MNDLREFTSARVALGRSGNALPTSELLKLQLAHARARQAVHSRLDVTSVVADLARSHLETVHVKSAAEDRTTYLRRPDQGRRLNDESRTRLQGEKGDFDAVFVVADGLSASGVRRHAVNVITACLELIDRTEWRLAPVVVAEQGRVALGDEVAECLGARLSIVLIGERPGLSSVESLGAYLTWAPQVGRMDAERNCISNIHQEGLSYPATAQALVLLMSESRRRQLSGVPLARLIGALDQVQVNASRRTPERLLP